MSQIRAIVADTETVLNVSPFLPRNPVRWESDAGATVNGVNLSGKDARGGNYQRWVGDGSTVAWTSTTLVNLANAHVDGGALSQADVLRVVVKVNGAILKRVAASATPGAGEFKTSGSVTLTLGTAPALGAKVEFFLQAAADVGSSTIPAGGVSHEVAANEVVISSAAATVSRLTR